MKFHEKTAELFIPDGLTPERALARTTHLAVGAHQDDLEIMAFDGILACFQREDLWFTGVVVTDGSGSPREGIYAHTTDEAMCAIRRKEQRKAAVVGEYAAQALLDYPSGAVKDGSNKAPVDDLVLLLRAARPRVVYTHNLADKHDTHVGVAIKLIAAIRRLSPHERPEKLYGCEVWRDLDWMVESDKVTFDLSAHENLQASLLGLFDSQVAGGKRYDLATLARRRANATYFASHGVDVATGLTYAMDLTPLLRDDDLDPSTFVKGHIDRFAGDVATRIAKLR
ncbi:MAG: PIG-L family deacetylase [Planctomycetota bacterium]